MIENINSKLENLSSPVKNQLSFNKMIETQIAQIPVFDLGKISRKPGTSLESIKMVLMRFDKPLRQVNYDYLLDPPFTAKKRRS